MACVDIQGIGDLGNENEKCKQIMTFTWSILCIPFLLNLSGPSDFIQIMRLCLHQSLLSSSLGLDDVT